jgi:hypothetical protein
VFFKAAKANAFPQMEATPAARRSATVLQSSPHSTLPQVTTSPEFFKAAKAAITTCARSAPSHDGAAYEDDVHQGLPLIVSNPKGLAIRQHIDAVDEFETLRNNSPHPRAKIRDVDGPLEHFRPEDGLPRQVENEHTQVHGRSLQKTKSGPKLNTEELEKWNQSG